jgi:hypothetical protein
LKPGYMFLILEPNCSQKIKLAMSHSYVLKASLEPHQAPI